MYIIKPTNIYFTLNFRRNTLVAQAATSSGISNIFLGRVYKHINYIIICGQFG